MRNLLGPLVVGWTQLLSAIIFGQPLTLEQLLNRMDEAGSRVYAMRAEIHQRKWTDILEEFDAGESGHFSFLRTQDGVYLRKDIEQPTKSTLVIKEGRVVFFQPAIKQAQIYNLGSHGDKAEFLLLGFGSQKHSLKDTYRIRLVGRESVDTRESYQIELSPKSDKIAAFFVKILLWVDCELWVPIQQQLVEPTQDYLLIRFGNIELNPKLSTSAFEVKLPKDVQIIQN